MSNLSPQRKKAVILAAVIPCTTMPAMLAMQHVHGSSLRIFVIAYALIMATIFAYVVSQLAKLKRSAKLNRSER